jgi:uncharacterized cupin superfamily protein
MPNVADLPHRELATRSGELLSHSAVLTEMIGLKDVFVHHEILPAGRRASSPHAHSHQEEMVFVLSGEIRAHCRGETHVLKPGDFYGFPPGEENTHFVENASHEEARFLVIASNPAHDRPIYSL